MPRPRQTVSRDHQLNLSLTLAEHELLARRAEGAGLRLAAYAREVLLGAPSGILQGQVVSAAERLMLSQWQRCGANLNQLTRRFHSLGQIEPDDLAMTLAELRRLLDEASR